MPAATSSTRPGDPRRAAPPSASSPYRALRAALRGDRIFQGVAALFVADTVLLLVLLPLDEPGWVTVVGRLTVLVGCLSLVYRERWPVRVGALVLVLAALYYPTGEQDGVLMMVVYAVAIYTVALRGQLAAAVTLAVLTLLALAYSESVTRARGDGNVDDMAFVLMIGWFVGVIAFGQAMRARQAYLAEVEQRARAAERERDARARQSATEERLRIARELHDVLGHNISLIHVQSAAALHRSAKRPGQTAELSGALESVRDISREALRELRATLGVLRQVDEGAPTAPAAGLERLSELAARASGAGLDVRVRTEGEPVVVPPQISLAAYRVIQESLTNVARHSGADTVHVTVGYLPGRLRLSVVDNGSGDPGRDSAGAGGDRGGPRVAGSGINGMRERTRALGGDLSAGPGEHGFEVSGWLPLPGVGGD